MISLSDTVGKTSLLWAPQIAFIQGTLKPVEHLLDCPRSSFLAVRDVPVGRAGSCFQQPGESSPKAALTHSTWELWAVHTWGRTRARGHCPTSGLCRVSRVCLWELQGMLKARGSAHLSFLRALYHHFLTVVSFYQHHPTCIPAVACHSSKTELSAKKSPAA